jgi:hypothetical protein
MNNDKERLKSLILKEADCVANYIIDGLNEPVGLCHTVRSDNMKVIIDVETIGDNSYVYLNKEERACRDIYTAFHVSEMKGQPESVKRAWSIGQEIYNNIKDTV